VRALAVSSLASGVRPKDAKENTGHDCTFQSAGLTQHTLTTVGGESLPRRIGAAPHSEMRFQSKGLTQHSLGQRANPKKSNGIA